MILQRGVYVFVFRANSRSLSCLINVHRRNHHCSAQHLAEQHLICWMSAGSRSSPPSQSFYESSNTCSYRNYKHVIKSSELIQRVSTKLMRSCHMVFIEMRWASLRAKTLASLVSSASKNRMMMHA